MVDQKWGSHPIDRFALQMKKKYIRFNSGLEARKPVLGGGGVANSFCAV